MADGWSFYVHLLHHGVVFGETRVYDLVTCTAFGLCLCVSTNATAFSGSQAAWLTLLIRCQNAPNVISVFRLGAWLKNRSSPKLMCFHMNLAWFTHRSSIEVRGKSTIGRRGSQRATCAARRQRGRVSWLCWRLLLQSPLRRAQSKSASPVVLLLLRCVALYVPWGAVTHTDMLLLQTESMVFQYIPDVAMDLNASAYLPAFLMETDWTEIAFALQEACVASYQMLRLWAVFGALVAMPILQGLELLFEALLPHFIAVLRYAGESIQELDPLYQVLLAVGLILTVVCIRMGYVRKARLRYVAFRRRSEMRYRAFVLSLSEKWRLAALMLPHLVFFLLTYGTLPWMPSLVIDIWDSEVVLSLLGVGYPLLRTIGAVRSRRIALARQQQAAPVSEEPQSSARQAVSRRRSGVSSSSTKAPSSTPTSDYRAYEACLKYWVLWSLLCSILSMFSLFVPVFMAAWFTPPTYVCNIGLVWIHSPITRGDITLYTLLSPLFNPYMNRIKDAVEEVDEHANEATNFIMRALVSFNVVKQNHIHFLKDMWAQGPALGGLMFVFTPGFVTARGCWLIGFGFPAYVTMGALAEKRARRYEWWLSYFCVAVTANYCITAIGESFSWVPFFYHGKLLLLLWLQFPYFRGAQRVFDVCFSSLFVTPDRMAKKDN